jgi:hypothetical protein
MSFIAFVVVCFVSMQTLNPKTLMGHFEAFRIIRDSVLIGGVFS